MKILKSDLIRIVEASVGEALKSDFKGLEAQRQSMIQRNVEDKISRSTGSGEKKEDKLGKEASTDPLNAAPKKPEDSSQAASIAPVALQQQAELIDADAIIDKFNIIRSGRSLNDRDVRDSLKKFLGSLDKGQQKGLFDVLKQIAQVAAPPTAQVDAARLHAPEDEPSPVKDARLKMLQQKFDKEQSQSASAPKAAPAPQKKVSQQRVEKDDESGEDRTPPIKVGSRTSESLFRQMKSVIHE